MSHKVIQQLLAVPGLNIECPNCNEEFPIKRAKLFNMYDTYPPAVQKIIRDRLNTANEQQTELKNRRKQLRENKKKKPERIEIAAQASTFGQISEQILPAFITFPYKQCECRILFKPIDYIIFCGLEPKGKIESIKFVDVKTGNGRLTQGQRQIRDQIVEGNVKHKVIGK